MNRNTARITAGLIALTGKPYEIISGSVVPGSLDPDNYTISVQTTDGEEPIMGVMLNPVAGNGNGLILFPEDGSNVIIGSIDGPGEWTLIRASNLLKIKALIGSGANSTSLTLTDDEVEVVQGDAIMTMKNGKFSFKNGEKDLTTILSNILQHIQLMTVTTGTGPSGPPINIADFVNDALDVTLLLD
jgi:hypothetical protein